ncbi:helix-turn-helix domain-containing protein [Pseudomonas atacamensis]|jgi:predicted transcriptional regulator|uniref:helix-turn-helix domain-containing protein n=1 Tax=Pseudomonas atacamensis TaxID=2565368 RepID=UPI00381D7547
MTAKQRTVEEPSTTPPQSPSPTAAPIKKNSNVLKWGKPNIDAGWTCIPNILIHRQRTLGLDAVDLNILLHLITYWWEDENLPHPSKDTLAKSMGVSPSTIQRHIRAMEKVGFLKRIIRPKAGEKNDTNLYDLTPLRTLLEPHAKVELEARQASRDKKRERKTKVALAPERPPA